MRQLAWRNPPVRVRGAQGMIGAGRSKTAVPVARPLHGFYGGGGLRRLGGCGFEVVLAIAAGWMCCAGLGAA